MVLTYSTMMPLGTVAPDFTLTDVVTGNQFSLDTMQGNHAVLIMFLCRHCPYVKHVQDELTHLIRDYSDKPLGIIAISANDAENYPEDAPEQLKAMAQDLGWSIPYGYDESQTVAKAYTAACTPDFFLFDENLKLVYRGQFDESRPGNNLPVNGQDLRAAIEAVLSNQPVSTDQKPSVGCNIKWKPGNEPRY